jgi:hypothetical protein
MLRTKVNLIYIYHKFFSPLKELELQEMIRLKEEKERILKEK